jgi:hypothetical protein
VFAKVKTKFGVCSSINISNVFVYDSEVCEKFIVCILYQILSGGGGGYESL